MSGSSRTAGTRTAKPAFSVFTDSGATSSKQGSSSSTTGPGKRIKTASSSSARPLQVLGSKAGLSQTASTEDKENDDPTGRRSGKPGKALALGSKAVKPSSANIIAPAKSSNAKLWAGKTPFEPASPESCTCSKTASKANTIYDLPGTEAIASSRPLPSAATTMRAAAPRSRIAGAGAVSRPNKKPAASVNTTAKKPPCSFQIFQDGLESVSADRLQVLQSPALRRLTNTAVEAGAADRRVRELTESQLADVTQAYTGKGRFSNSPMADSGFGGSAHASREPSASPLPIRSLSHKDLQDLQLVLEAESSSTLEAIDELPLPQYRESSVTSSPKRRYSQISIPELGDGVSIEENEEEEGQDGDNNDIVTPRNLTKAEEKRNPFVFARMQTPRSSSGSVKGLHRRMAGLRV